MIIIRKPKKNLLIFNVMDIFYSKKFKFLVYLFMHTITQYRDLSINKKIISRNGKFL